MRTRAIPVTKPIAGKHVTDRQLRRYMGSRHRCALQQKTPDVGLNRRSHAYIYGQPDAQPSRRTRAWLGVEAMKVVHPGKGCEAVVATPNRTPQEPWMNNLHSFDN